MKLRIASLVVAIALLPFTASCGGEDDFTPPTDVSAGENDAGMSGPDAGAEADTAGPPADTNTAEPDVATEADVVTAADVATPPDTQGPDVLADVAVDVTIDVPEDVSTEDIVPDVPEDVPDPYTVDAVEPEQALAWAWADPDKIYVEPAEMVQLENVGEEGLMKGPWANVSNCVNKEGGVSTTQNYNGMQIDVALCVIEQTVAPDEDGNYLSVVPPKDPLDPDDPFAELQMFFHMNRIHDYFSGVHGNVEMDRPLRAVVNIQVAVTMLGTMWMSIDNAAFIPRDSLRAIGQMLGVAVPIDEDAIIFAQGPSLDFAYDGDVIYHEYTHAMIGAGKLMGVRVDDQGPDMAPLSLNEAHADYFAAALTGSPVMGGWSLGALASPRDLSIQRRCPDYLVGESHHDGQVFSSALWTVRQAIGAEQTDAIAYDALMTYGAVTSFDEAAEAVIAAAAELDPPRDVEVAAAFAEHGLPGCLRVRPLVTGEMIEGLANVAPGTRDTGVYAFSNYTPSYVQFGFDVDEGTELVTLTFRVEEGGGGDMLSALMGPSEPPELLAGLKRGGDPIRWNTTATPVSNDSEAVVEVNRDGANYSIALAGSCLTPGRHVLQLMNVTQSGGYLQDMLLEQYTSADDTELPIQPYDCQ